MKKNKKTKKNQGSVLVVSLIILGMVLVIALSVALVSVRERKASMTSSKSDVSYQNAESGVEKAMGVILQGLGDVDEETSSSGVITIKTVADKIGSCSDNEILTNEISGSSVYFIDKNGSLINCDKDDDNDGSDIYTVQKIKAVGADPQSQTQRAINAPAVQKDPKIKLLLHADKLDSGGNFIDSSRVHHAVTKNGEVSINNSDLKFGIGNASFNGSGDYLILDSSHDWNFSDRSFTIDFWAKFDTSGSPPTVQTLIDLDGAVKESYDITNKQFTVTFNNDPSSCTFNLDSDLSDEDWHHVALVKNDSEVKLYMDGESVADPCNYSSSLDDPMNIYIGCDSDGSECFKGNIDELRIYRDFTVASRDGGAYWTGNFDSNLPTEPY